MAARGSSAIKRSVMFTRYCYRLHLVVASATLHYFIYFASSFFFDFEVVGRRGGQLGLPLRGTSNQKYGGGYSLHHPAILLDSCASLSLNDSVGDLLEHDDAISVP